jgi:hypothetical protein
VAEVGAKELLRVADESKTPALRAIAIRALGRSSHAIPAAKVASWIRDPSIDVRRAAVLVSAELSDHEPIVTASRDGSLSIRQEAVSRAKRFREAAARACRLACLFYFDQVDKNPDVYLQ